MKKYEFVQVSLVNQCRENGFLTSAETIEDAIVELVDEGKDQYPLAIELLFGYIGKDVFHPMWIWIAYPQLLKKMAKHHHWGDEDEGFGSFRVYPGNWITFEEEVTGDSEFLALVHK